MNKKKNNKAKPFQRTLLTVTVYQIIKPGIVKQIIQIIWKIFFGLQILFQDLYLGCSLNKGIQYGASMMVEVMLEQVMRHVICALHLFEQMFWHILADTVTKGPDSLKGHVTLIKKVCH